MEQPQWDCCSWIPEIDLSVAHIVFVLGTALRLLFHLSFNRCVIDNLSIKVAEEEVKKEHVFAPV